MSGGSLAAVLAIVASATTAEGATPRAGPRIEARMVAASPAALGAGQLLGPSLEGAWLLDDFALAVRAHLGFVEADDPTWRVSHSEVRVGVLGAYVAELGRGEISLGVELGAIGLREVRTRHQAERLGSAGLDAETDGFALGAFASLELGVRLFVLDEVAVVIGGGPDVTVVSIAGGRAQELGWIGGLGLAWAPR